MEITDHSVGYFAVLIETVDEKQWSFYKAGHPTRARQLAMMRQETLKVLRVIMITKGQYETGLHNLKILDEQKRTSAKVECASRIELQRHRDRKKNSNRSQKPKQIA